MKRQSGLPLLMGTLAGCGIAFLLWNLFLVQPSPSSPDGSTGPGLNSLASKSVPLSDDPDANGSQWWVDSLQRVTELGYTPEAIEQVALGLPADRAQAFRLLAIEGLAESDVQGAIAYALMFDTFTAQLAGLRQVARIAAASDPISALDSAALIPNGSQREDFVEAVMEVWSTLDPAGMLAWLERTGISGKPLTADMLASLGSTEPERLLSLLHQLPLDMPGTDAERNALIDALLIDDPGVLYAFVEARDPDHDKDAWLLLIAQRHIQLDARQALEYVLSTEAPMVIAVHQALLAIPDEHFEADFRVALARSIEMLAGGEEPQLIGGRLGWLFRSALERDASNIEAMVDAVAIHPSSRVRNQVGIGIDADFSIVATWAEYDPVSAIAWAIQNPTRVSPSAIEQLGRIFAEESLDPAVAQRHLYALPEEMRGYWMAGVAEGIASSNLEAALDWLEPVRDAPVYATVIDSVLWTAASTDPVEIARVIDVLPDTPSEELVLIVAARWGSSAPASAADWLVSSQNIDDEARAMAVRQVVIRWADRDLRGAQVWTRSLASGELHDAALGAVVEAAAAAGSLDPQLLTGFSSDSSRAQAIIGAMEALRGIDPELGRSLIDQYIRDPGLRVEAAQILDGSAPFRFPRQIDGITMR